MKPNNSSQEEGNLWLSVGIRLMKKATARGRGIWSICQGRGRL